jgi:hypothetical protein
MLCHVVDGSFLFFIFSTLRHVSVVTWPGNIRHNQTVHFAYTKSSGSALYVFWDTLLILSFNPSAARLWMNYQGNPSEGAHTPPPTSTATPHTLCPVYRIPYHGSSLQGIIAQEGSIRREFWVCFSAGFERTVLWDRVSLFRDMIKWTACVFVLEQAIKAQRGIEV